MTVESLEHSHSHSPPAIPTPSTHTSDPTSLDQDDLSILSEDLCMPIAIVGMGFRGPGDATGIKELWTMILQGREAWSPIPESRWNNAAFYHPDHSRYGTINVAGGHFLAEDVSLFDAPFFNMTSDEAAAMDPQQRLLLEVTYEGFENAGIPITKITGSRTACFVGCFNADYTDLLLRDPDCVPMYQCTNSGQSRAMTANRVSYFFDMKGPSVTVDTACSGSLTALHLACQSLRIGDASMAVAAGVNVILSHEFMFLSPDGRCYTFDENASGYARGEGIGCLILKPLRDAIHDHDPIRAIIRGSGLNQDGRTPGITLPSGGSQEALMRHVYQVAGLDPGETDFVEAHGTGTQAGDHIETAALAKVFCHSRSSTRPLRIGSIKTNVGHLEGTSGVAGVIKAVLMLENRTFLPNRNFRVLNPRIHCDEWKLKVQLSAEPWDCPGPHRVSVNSFGYGGSNAHVILEDTSGYLSDRTRGGTVRHARPSAPARTRIYMVSGFDEGSTTRQLRNLRAYVLDEGLEADDECMKNLAYTLNERRVAHTCRAAIVGTSASTLVEALAGRIKVVKARRRPNIGFVFTGQGAQWAGMGKELLEAYPVFRASIQKMGDYMKSLGAPYCMAEEILKDEEVSRLSQPLLSQPICSALQIALVDLLVSWDIHPDSVTGHSSGEIAAAYAMGTLTMEDAMTVAYYRGVVASNLQIKGAMLALGMSAQESQAYVDKLQSGKAVVACINSPSSVTISGDLSAIDELEQIVREKQVFSRRLAVEVAYHSHHMELVKDAYLGHIAQVRPQSHEDIAKLPNDRSVSFFSSVTGAEVQPSELGPQYWARNLVGQVKFADSLRTLCFETTSHRGTFRTQGNKRVKRAGVAQKVSVDILVEVGPHATLAGPIKQTLRDDSKLNAAEVLYISVLTRRNNAVTTALTAAATLLCSGYPVDSQAINNPIASQDFRVLVDLPSYAWSHTETHWAESRISKTFRNRKYPRTDLLGAMDRMSCPFQPLWRNFIRVSELPWLLDHKIESNIVYPAAGYIVMTIEAFLQHSQHNTTADKVSAIYFRDIAIQSALVIHETAAIEIVLSLNQCEDSSPSSHQLHRFNIYSVTQDNIWTGHCKGFVGTQHDDQIELKCASPRTERFDFTSLDTQLFYKKLATAGLEYGPCFANITQARYTDNMCEAEIIAPDTAAVMPMNFQYPFLIHPCTLDSIIHTIFVSTGAIDTPAVPVRIDEMSVSCRTTYAADSKLKVWTETKRRMNGDLTALISVADESRQPAISITGLRCKRLGPNPTSNPQSPMNHITHMLKWEVDPDLLSGAAFSDIVSSSRESKKKATGFSALHEECALYYIKEFVKHIDQSVVKRLQPFRKKQLDFFNEITTQRSQVPHDVQREDIERVRSSGPEGKILCAVGQKLSAIVVDEVETGTVDQSLWDEYWGNIYDDPAYDTVSRYLDLVSHKNPMVSILEVEATTGGASRRFLRRLAGAGGGVARFTKYTITHPDLSLETEWKEIDARDHCTEMKALDVESDLDVQGFGVHQYDVVIASHGLYTVKSKYKALSNIHRLLKPNGYLILIDPLSQPQLSEYVIFANFPGPWKQDGVGYFDNDMITTLKDAQFSEGHLLNKSRDEHMVIVSQPTRQQTSPLSEILLVAEDEPCGVHIAHLQDLLSSISPKVDTVQLAHATPGGKICIILSDLKVPVLAHPSQTSMDITKQMFLNATGVLWVTRGGTITPVNPDAGIVTGFARTARSESGVEHIITLDLDGRRPLCGHRSAEVIYDVVRHRILGGKSAILDTEYVERDGVLLVPRIVENQLLNETFASVHDLHTTSVQAFHQESRHLRAVANEDFHSEGIHFIDDNRITALADDHVRIEVHAIRLSERDAQRVENQASDTGGIGLGCSGTVRAVGKAVHNLVVGDRVACLRSGTAASIYQDTMTAFQKIPLDMSFEVAAGIPAAYCTMFHAVHCLAGIKPGDRILIHSAAGAVGEAAIDLCTAAGAHTFAIVGSALDKERLASSSLLPEERILLGHESYLHDLMRSTDDKGVEVIVNCGNPDNSTFRSLWRCLGSSGRFIQLHAHNNAFTKSHWEIPEPSSNIHFATLDIEQLVKSDPKVLDNIWDQVARLFREGRLRGPSQLTTYSISNITEALDVLRLTEHSESIVLTAGADDTVKTLVPKQGMLLRPDVSYMLVGGLGGIGRATALWMVDHGAKTIIFVNRSGLSRASSQATVQELRGNGVQVLVHACDISNRDHVMKMMNDLEAAPPIRGVIQAAMVLRDIHIEKMTLEDYNAVLQPKYDGTWNLHRYLPSDLDWFIVLSSISGIIGNATQAAYAAGSTFMDSFAAYRNSLGLPSVSLDLGVITDTGYLAENTELASKMAQQGFQGTDTKTVMKLIEVAITSCQKDRATSQIITGLGQWKEGQSLPNFDAPLFSHFRRRYLDLSVSSENQIPDTLKQDLQAAKTLDDATAVIYTALSARIAAHLSISVDSINPTGPITEYGIDSHVAVELRNWISKHIEGTVPILEILASSSLMELAGKIAGRSDLVKVEQASSTN
ncbi:hypothetical protein BDV28DRAFT_144737 [Aspergillus coremiiformis]|uniref:Polyketide synthase n=1 Tax=Aspergillus coremiiformis TaxID=138285 RepID=A0A5N6ZGR3_9EURO|nr:hypothetical protein BDV28DRAFT_144737 [Aspergillus coremiiformis]